MPRPPETDPDWPLLMALAQEGDRAAYGQLLIALIPWLRVVLDRRLDDRPATEDAVLAALASVHLRRHTYDPRRPIGPWLAAIVEAEARRARARSLKLEAPGRGKMTSPIVARA